MFKYWKRMMSKVFNSSNNTNIVAEVPTQIFFFALDFCEQNNKIFSPWKNCANMSVAVVIPWKCFLKPNNTIWGMFLSPQYWKKKGKKCNPQKFRNFELLSFETQKNIKGLMRSVGYLFRTVVLLFVQILSLSTSKKDHTEVNI